MKHIPTTIWTKHTRRFSLLRIMWLKQTNKKHKSKRGFCRQVGWKKGCTKKKPHPWMSIFNLNPATKEQNALVCWISYQKASQLNSKCIRRRWNIRWFEQQSDIKHIWVRQKKIKCRKNNNNNNTFEHCRCDFVFVFLFCG